MAQKLSNLSVGAKIKFGKHSIASETAQPIIWVVADKNHSGYPSGAITLITDKIIDMRAYDGMETGNTRGNSDYSLSNIHQWLNSSASAGQWFTATHANDTAPTDQKVVYNPYKDRPGFLYNFTSTERQCLLPTTLTVQNSGAALSNITATIFLPSVWEIRGQGDYEDGSSRLAYFTTQTASATVSAQVFNSSIEPKPGSLTEYWSYYTRSRNGNSVRIITTNGGAEDNSPYEGEIGIRPIINLNSDIKITDTTDSDGCYMVLTQTAPTISGSNTNLGTKSAEFNHTYTVNDADAGTSSDSVTVTEYIDNVSIRSYVATKNATNTFAVTGNTWYKLSNGVHTLKITATDGFDTVTRTITFTKSVTKLVAQRTTPIAASTMPTRIIVTLVKNVPSNAEVIVEVCNNGFDSTPTWERIETYASGLAHTFSNKTNTAGKWGVNIRVTVNRNGAEGACYITEIGGNFE